MKKALLVGIQNYQNPKSVVLLLEDSVLTNRVDGVNGAKVSVKGASKCIFFLMYGWSVNLVAENVILKMYCK